MEYVRDLRSLAGTPSMGSTVSFFRCFFAGACAAASVSQHSSLFCGVYV